MRPELTGPEEIEVLPFRWIRPLVWPENLSEAVGATLFAFLVLSVGFLNPWATPIWTLSNGTYDPFSVGIYAMIIKLSIIPFAISLALFAFAKQLRSAIAVPQLIHFAILLTFLVLGILATYECYPDACYR